MANHNTTRNWSLEAKIAYWSDPAPNGCLIWAGWLGTDGYATLWRDGHQRRVSRLIWAHIHGPITPGQLVCHTCDTPACVNIDHLWIGSALNNSHDMVKKSRQLKGSDSPTAKLTEVQAREIYHSAETQVALAKRFGVTQAAISLIKLRRNWRHLSMD